MYRTTVKTDGIMCGSHINDAIRVKMPVKKRIFQHKEKEYDYECKL